MLWRRAERGFAARHQRSRLPGPSGVGRIASLRAAGRQLSRVNFTRMPSRRYRSSAPVRVSVLSPALGTPRSRAAAYASASSCWATPRCR